MLLAMPVLVAPPVALAQEAGSPAPVDVIEVKGRIDAIEASFLARSIRNAAQAGSQLLVVQLDSPGTVLSNAELDELAVRITDSEVPVVVWVGPSGARAYGGAVRLVRAASVSGMANGAKVGLPRGRAVDLVTPTLGDLIVELDGRAVGGRTLETARVVERDGQPRREPTVQVRFAKLNIIERVLHATTTPAVAYLLLVLGLLLVLFEFYSAGIGVAGLTGAAALVLSAYGLGALGATPLGLALVALATFGFAVDVQAGAPRAWTVIGTAALVIGSWVLFPSDRRVSWIVIALVVAGSLLFVLRGMTVMVRTRFSTATISREVLIGERAEATTPVAPTGVVRLRGALWPARTARTAPIQPGEAARVTGIDGLFLEIEADDRRPGGGRSQGD